MLLVFLEQNEWDYYCDCVISPLNPDSQQDLDSAEQ
jgi:hypothetical protein